MTSATKAALRARISKPRNVLSIAGPIVLKAVAGGLAALTVVFTVITGAGWLLAVSLQARSDIRTVAAVPPARPAWIAMPGGGMQSQAAVVASLSPPQTVSSLQTAVLNPIGSLALVIPESSDSPAHTGSIATNLSEPAAPTFASRWHPRPVPRREVHELPLPRPRLAALGPVQNLGGKLEEDVHPFRTAVYDITAQTVYLPSGERLEAHSGLGNLMDDPRHVRVKNQGATPPNIYDLKLRESLFHGVQAVRLTPVDEEKMFNRDGILAHSYMLGPSGQSNGCVSFKDYPRFLRAYLRGEIDRIVVVSRLTKPPVFAARPPVRSANAL
jgi:hypothetical protein